MYAGCAQHPFLLYNLNIDIGCMQECVQKITEAANLLFISAIETLVRYMKKFQ